jgi:hypothetical protein
MTGNLSIFDLHQQHNYQGALLPDAKTNFFERSSPPFFCISLAKIRCLSTFVLSSLSSDIPLL